MFRLFCCTPIIPLHIEIQLSKLFMRPYRILLQITPIKVSQSSEWAAPRSEGLPKVGEQEASLPDLPTRPSHVSLAFALSMIMHFFVPVCSGYWILIVLTDWIGKTISYSDFIFHKLAHAASLCKTAYPVGTSRNLHSFYVFGVTIKSSFLDQGFGQGVDESVSRLDFKF